MLLLASLTYYSAVFVFALRGLAAGSVLSFTPKFLLSFMLTGLLSKLLDYVSISDVYLALTNGLNTASFTANPCTITLNILVNSSLLMKLWLKLNFLIDLSNVSF